MLFKLVANKLLLIGIVKKWIHAWQSGHFDFFLSSWGGAGRTVKRRSLSSTRDRPSSTKQRHRPCAGGWAAIPHSFLQQQNPPAYCAAAVYLRLLPLILAFCPKRKPKLLITLAAHYLEATVCRFCDQYLLSGRDQPLCLLCPGIEHW